MTIKFDDDESHLIRLFRSLDPSARNKVLQSIARSCLQHLVSKNSATTTNAPRDEDMPDTLDDELMRFMPLHNPFVDLHDYDYHPAREAWPDIAWVILGSSEMDLEAAEALVESYLGGAERYDHPLPMQFVDSGENEEELKHMLYVNLNGEALRLIREWRQRCLARLRSRPSL